MVLKILLLIMNKMSVLCIIWGEYCLLLYALQQLSSLNCPIDWITLVVSIATYVDNGSHNPSKNIYE